MMSRIAPYAAVAGGLAVLLSIVTQASGDVRIGRRSLPPQAVEATRIEVDNATKTIRFYIDNKQVAVFDSLGLKS